MQAVSFSVLKRGQPTVINFNSNLALVWINKESAIKFETGRYKVASIYLTDYCEDPHNPTPTELSLIELTLGITIDLKG